MTSLNSNSNQPPADRLYIFLPSYAPSTNNGSSSFGINSEISSLYYIKNIDITYYKKFKHKK